MSIVSATRTLTMIPTIAAFGIILTAPQAVERASAANGSLSCGIDVNRSRGRVELRAIVAAPRQASGSYHLRVVKTGDGSATIDQSGGFAVGPGSSAVSTVSLGGGGIYTARLAVTADGQTVECSQRVSGSV